jgi:hypothetical protein
MDPDARTKSQTSTPWAAVTWASAFEPPEALALSAPVVALIEAEALMFASARPFAVPFSEERLADGERDVEKLKGPGAGVVSSVPVTICWSDSVDCARALLSTPASRLVIVIAASAGAACAARATGRAAIAARRRGLRTRIASRPYVGPKRPVNAAAAARDQRSVA